MKYINIFYYGVLWHEIYYKATNIVRFLIGFFSSCNPTLTWLFLQYIYSTKCIWTHECMTLKLRVMKSKLISPAILQCYLLANCISIYNWIYSQTHLLISLLETNNVIFTYWTNELLSIPLKTYLSFNVETLLHRGTEASEKQHTLALANVFC